MMGSEPMVMHHWRYHPFRHCLVVFPEQPLHHIHCDAVALIQRTVPRNGVVDPGDELQEEFSCDVPRVESCSLQASFAVQSGAHLHLVPNLKTNQAHSAHPCPQTATDPYRGIRVASHRRSSGDMPMMLPMVLLEVSPKVLLVLGPPD